MKLKLIKKVLLLPLLMLCFSVTEAHHSSVVFDHDRTIDVKGEVSQFVYRNPHLIITLDVINDAGETEIWNIEGQSIAALTRVGFNRTTISEGDTVTVKVYPMKTGEPGGLLRGLVDADGQAYSMGDDSATPSDSVDLSGVAAAFSDYTPPPEGETWQQREEKTRPASLPIVSQGLAPGDSSFTGKSIGALDPENLNKERPAAPFDLTGVWQFRAEDEWRDSYGSYEFKPMPELTPAAKSYYQEYIDSAAAGTRFDDPTKSCYPGGMPRMMTRYGSMMMIQMPTAIFMVSRMNNELRVIYTDGRDRISENYLDRNWAGESIGRWEGDTLVVETTGFIGENHMIQAGVKASNQLKIIERIKVTNDGNTIVTEYTMTDPVNWVGEWQHTKFRDRVLRSDIKEANCLPADNSLLPGTTK